MGVKLFCRFGILFPEIGKKTMLDILESKMGWVGSGTPIRPLTGGKLNFAHFEHFRQMLCAFFSAKAVFNNKSEMISLGSFITK